jgi:hypothetical protein
MLYESILREEQEDNEILRKGTWVGRLVSNALHDSIAGAEEYVALPSVGIHGYIDIMLASGIPMEVKTVSNNKALKSLRGPKSAAVSQANFYALATNAPYSYVAYFARDDPSQYRLFKVDANPERLLSDRVEVLQAYQTAQEAGLYQPPVFPSRFFSFENPLSGISRLQEQVWETIVPPVRVWNPMPENHGVYPRAVNAFDAVPALRDYGHTKHQAFYRTGHGGLVQLMHSEAKGAKIKDQRTRLKRVHPQLATTRSSVMHCNRASRCEVR